MKKAIIILLAALLTTISVFADETRVERGAIGNIIWNDMDQDGFYNSETESGIGGVLFYLYDETGAVFGDPNNPRVTDVDGSWSVEQLPMFKSYYIEIIPANFEAGGALETFGLTTQPTGFEDPNNDRDHDNNGILNGGSVFTAPIELTPSGEPTDDEEIGSTPSGNANSTLDVGFKQETTAVALSSNGAAASGSYSLALIFVLFLGVTITVRNSRTWQ